MFALSEATISKLLDVSIIADDPPTFADAMTQISSKLFP